MGRREGGKEEGCKHEPENGRDGRRREQETESDNYEGEGGRE